MTNLKNGNLATASAEKWEPPTWPTSAVVSVLPKRRAGRSATRPPFAMAKFDLYQCVVPTTWNASPRDPKGQIGAL
ncbi:nickel-dependent hydrogenase large subunit [Shigella flexneri]